MGMKNACENRLCIYWENGACLLAAVEHDALGICASCIWITWDDETLDRERARLLREIDARRT